MFSVIRAFGRPVSLFQSLVFAIVFGVGAQQASAAITLDSTSSQAAGAGVTTLTWSHTLGSGTNRMVVCGVTIADPDGAIAPMAPTLTFDGIAATAVSGGQAPTHSESSTSKIQTQLFYILDASLATGAGTYTVNVSIPTAPTGGAAAGCTSLFGVNQSAPEAVATGYSGSGTAPTVTPALATLTAGAWVIDSFGGGFGSSGGVMTPNTGQIQLYNVVNSGLSTAGTKTGVTGAGSYEVAANPGSVITGWTGSVSRTAYVLASFAPAATANYTVTATVNPGSAGTVTLSPNQANYLSGTSIQATATPAAGYVFANWSGDLSGSTNPATLVVDADKNITANFAVATCSLTVNVVGSGTVSPNTGSYACGTPVTLTATAATGWSFGGFTGGYVGTTSPATFTLNANATVTATFVQGASCTLATNVTGSGSITLNPSGGVYSCGTNVTVTAVPTSGDWTFTGWGGALSGTTNPAILTLNANSTVSAAFTQTNFPINLTVAGPGTVAQSPAAASYATGTTVTLTATPNSGARFTGWSGDLSGSTNPATVTVDAAKNITATFANLQITQDAVSHAASTGAASTLSWTHTLGGGSSRAVVIEVASVDSVASPDANAVVTSVTFNGVYATPVPNSLIYGGTSGMVQAQLFYLLESELPPAGTYTVQVNLAGPIAGLTAGAISLVGVNQGPPESAVTHKDTSGADSISTAITTLTNNDWIVDVVTDNNATTLTASSGQTVAWRQSATTGTGGSSTEQVPTAGTVTLGWAGSASRLVHSLAAFAPASDAVPPSYSLTTGVSASGGGTVVTNPDLSTYPVGTAVQVTAVPANGYAFASWSGDITSTTNPISITIDANHSVTATFVAVPMCALTVNVTGNGTVNPTTGSYPCGSQLALAGTPGAGYSFTSWSGDFSSTDNPASFTLNAASTITAEFDPTPMCNFTAGVVGSGSMTPASGSYACGSVLTLTATPGDNTWAFSGWSGGYTGSLNPATLELDSDTSVTANFVQGSSCTLTTNVVGSGTITPSSGSYLCGTQINLTATPDAKYVFNGWSGALSGSTSPAPLTLSTNEIVTATFVPNTSGVTGDSRTVTEPVVPSVCTALTAAQSSSSLVETSPDTTRVQAALNACPSGQAVEFSPSADGTSNAFIIAPITLPPGVTMLVDAEVTIFGSLRYADYGCTSSSNWCTPLITVATNTDPSRGSAIMGYGVIDGRGGSAYTDTGKTAWGLSNEDLRPRLIFLGNHTTSAGADNFTLYKITIKNAGHFHVSGVGSNLTAWGVKIFAPPDSPNTDGIDPSGANNVTITNGYISNGDDMIAIKAGIGHVSNVTVSNMHLYSGHGVSVGSETNAGLNNLYVHDLLIDNNFGGSSANSLRIKSDSTRGGEVYDVLYKNICIWHGGDTIVFDPYYSSSTGSLYPNFHDITIQNLHQIYRDSGKKSTFVGYSTATPLTVTLNNVEFEGAIQNDYAAPKQVNTTIFTLGPDPVNIASFLQTDAATPTNDVSVINNVANSNAYFACTTDMFTYLAGELTAAKGAQSQTVTAGNPVTLTSILQNVVSPMVAGTISYPQQNNPTGTIDIMEGSTQVGIGTIASGNRVVYVTIPTSALTVGTHNYTAYYEGDSNYPAFSYGNVQVVVNSATGISPVAADQSVTAPYNTATPITLSATGSGTLVYSVVTNPAHGVLSGTPPSLTYTPSSGYSGADSFTFEASNGIDSNIATVSVSVLSAAPIAVSQTLSIGYNTATPITLSATGSGTLVYSVVTNPVHGILSGTAPNMTYTPTSGYSGPDSFTFKANNGSDSNVATITLNITPVAPMAANQAISAAYNTATPITLTATGSGTITYSVVTNPVHGQLSGAIPNLTYTPTTGYAGPDSFTFKANNGTDSNVATVNINVLAAAPIASAQTVTVPFNTATAIALNATGSGTFTYSVVSNPAHGTLSGIAPNLTYTPTSGYGGADSFTFKANNGTDSNVATVSINVMSAAPVASNQSVTVPFNTATAIALSATGSGTLTYSVMSNPAHGTLSGSAPNLTYTPTSGYSGADSFTFKANNGTDSNVATVSINVMSAAPVASSQSVTVPFNTATTVTLSATGAGTLVYSIVAGPAHGTLGVVSGNTVTYTPTTGFAGADSLTFKANNGTDGNVATVSITVSGDLTWSAASGGSMTATVSAGGTATYNLQVAGWTGANSTVTFGCIGAPAFATCSVTPLSTTLNGTAQIPVTVSVATTQIASLGTPKIPGSRSGAGLPVALAAGFVGCFIGLRRKLGSTRSWGLLAGCIALVVVWSITGCGSGNVNSSSKTAPGSYSLTVNAASGSVSKNVSLTLTVQ